MKWTVSIKASALYFALLAATLIALLLSSFLLLSKTQRIFQLKNNTVLSSLEAVTQGLNLALLGYAADAYSYNSRSVKLSQDAWGGFFLIKASDTTDSFGLEKQALVGAVLADRTSLILQDNFLPLVVAGNALVEGTAYLPERGVESAAIAGRYYLGRELIYGPYRNVSSIDFPKLDANWITTINSFISSVPESIEAIPKDLTNSFKNETAFYFAEDPLFIDQKLSGRIVVKSASSITITRQATLNDIVVIAPKVTVEDEVSGRLHVIAADSIHIGNRVNLKYPSSLSIIDRSDEQMTGQILIKEHARVAGNVIYFSELTNEQNLNANIQIDKDARVVGNVYANGAIEILGEIQGSLVCHYTLANQNSQKYRNYIFDGRIITRELPKRMAGLPLANNPKAVAQWLY